MSDGNFQFATDASRTEYLDDLKCRCGQAGTGRWESPLRQTAGSAPNNLVEVSAGFYLRVQKKDRGKTEAVCESCETAVQASTLQTRGAGRGGLVLKMEYHRKLAQELHNLAAKEENADLKQRLLARAQAYDELCERFLQRYAKDKKAKRVETADARNGSSGLRSPDAITKPVSS